MPCAVYDALPSKVQTLYDHAPLSPPPPSAEDMSALLVPAVDNGYFDSKNIATSKQKNGPF
jgi:hypothetical protein